MKKLIILLGLLLTLNGCRTVYVRWPDGKSVFVGSFGLDTKIGSFSAKNKDAEVSFSDVDEKANMEVLEKLVDKIPNANPLGSILE
jgi:hypothetical protein